MSFPRIPRPARIYPNLSGTSFIKRSFYLSSPKRVILNSPRMRLACPEWRDEETKNSWRSQMEDKIRSTDTYAHKFVTDVDAMQKRVEEMQRRVEEYLKHIWG